MSLLFETYVIYISIHQGAQTPIHIYTSGRANTHTYLYIRARKHPYISIHQSAQTPMHIYTSGRTNTHTYLYIRALKHPYISIHQGAQTPIHIYTSGRANTQGAARFCGRAVALGSCQPPVCLRST